MNTNFLLFVVTFICAVTGCLALSDGAPPSACSSLLPVHSGGSLQEDEAPYTVHAEKIGGNKVRVTISSPVGEEIKGFILQARSASDRNIFIAGEFKSNEVSKTVDCFNQKQSFLTHTDSYSKSQIITEWTETTPVNEDIIFRATVVKNYAVYWKDVDSEPVRMRTGGHMPSSSSSFSSSSSSSPSSSSSSSLRNFQDRDVPSIYNDCFKSKGCFGPCDDMDDMSDCEVLFTYQRSPDRSIRFTLHGSLQPSEYMAIGLSDDREMGDDFVTECVRGNSNNGTLRNSWNDGKSNGRTTEINDNFYFTLNNGLTTCVWTRPYTFTFNGRTYDLANRKYHVLLAKGSVYNDRIGYHSRRLASLDSVDFTQFGALASTGVSDSVKIHVLNLCIWLPTFIVSLKFLHFVLT